MKKSIRLDLVKIFLANIISQGFLLILTGTFWDDWIYYSHDRTALWRQFMEAGRPSSAYWIEAVWNIPSYGYRWLVFFMFTTTSILLYFFLKNDDNFSREESLYISILYTVLPINDCRVILCDVVYTVGLLSFFIGFFIFSLWQKEKIKTKRFLLRIVSLFFFGYSFIINSLLFFYAIVLIYILYVEYKTQGKMLAAILRMFRYLDFVILPILFFIGKQLLFPVFGRYENYNILTIRAIIIAACQLPLTIYKQLKLVWISCFSFMVPYKVILVSFLSVILFLGIRVIMYFREKRVIKVFFEITKNQYIKKLLFGIILFALGLYPYIVIRGTTTVDLVGVPSRDSMLLGLGLAMILYYFFMLLFKRPVSRKIVYSIVGMACTVTCNLHYMNYQRDAYWQEALMQELSQNNQIREATNILFLSDDSSGIYGTRFYSLNGNAFAAYGDQSRLFLNGYSDLSLLKSEKEVLVDSKGYLMNDYDASDNELDGVAVFNCDISYADCVRLKKLEMTNHSIYQEVISQIGTLAYYPVNSQEAITLLAGYEY